MAGGGQPPDMFWKAEPSRGKASNPRHAARVKFDAAVRDGADPRQIIAAARQWSNAEAENKTDPKYVAMAATWLHQKRFHDYTAPAAEVAGFTAYPDSPQFRAWYCYVKETGKIA